MASLEGVYSVVNGVRYDARDFLNPDDVQAVESGDGVTVVEMADGTEYLFAETNIRQRKAGENQIPRPFIPDISGKPAEKEKLIMATNMSVLRIDSNDPASSGGLRQSLTESLTAALAEWVAEQNFPDGVPVIHLV